MDEKTQHTVDPSSFVRSKKSATITVELVVDRIPFPVVKSFFASVSVAFSREGVCSLKRTATASSQSLYTAGDSVVSFLVIMTAIQ